MASGEADGCCLRNGLYARYHMTHRWKQSCWLQTVTTVSGVSGTPLFGQVWSPLPLTKSSQSHTHITENTALCNYYLIMRIYANLNQTLLCGNISAAKWLNYSEKVNRFYATYVRFLFYSMLLFFFPGKDITPAWPAPRFRSWSEMEEAVRTCASPPERPERCTTKGSILSRLIFCQPAEPAAT